MYKFLLLVLLLSSCSQNSVKRMGNDVKICDIHGCEIIKVDRGDK